MNPNIIASGQEALRIYREERAAAKAAGPEAFRKWNEEQELKKAQRGTTPMQAIRNFCLSCVGDSYSEVKNCSSTKCPLHIYRPYK
jgi:hypothetical protein